MHVPHRASKACSGLEPCGQCVSHAGYQEARRRFGRSPGYRPARGRDSCGRIDIPFQSFLGVDHGKRTAKRVAGGNGRANDHGQSQVGGLPPGGVKDFAAAGTDDRTRSVSLPCRLLDPRLISASAAFTAELVNVVVDSGFVQARFPGTGQPTDCGLAGDHEGRAFQAQAGDLHARARPSPPCLGCTG